MKYMCKACSNAALYADLYKTQTQEFPVAVYAHCPSCKIEAWGGLNFHPQMNEHFNVHFEASFEATFDPTFGKKIALLEL